MIQNNLAYWERIFNVLIALTVSCEQNSRKTMARSQDKVGEVFPNYA